MERVRPSEEADDVCGQKCRLARAGYEAFAGTAGKDVLAEVTGV